MNIILMFLVGLTSIASSLAVIYQVVVNKTAKGISLKSLELYLLANFVRMGAATWFGEDSLSIVFLFISLYIIYFVRTSPTYDQALDSLLHRHYVCIFAATVIAFYCIAPGLKLTQALVQLSWTGLFFRLLAFQAQLSMVQNSLELDNTTCHYVFLLGLCNVFLILNALASESAVEMYLVIMLAVWSIQVYMLKDFCLHYFNRFLRVWGKESKAKSPHLLSELDGVPTNV